ATLTAKVKGLSPNVTGQVIFRKDTISGQMLHETPLDLDENGEATLTFDLPGGRYGIYAEYRSVPGAAESYTREYPLFVENEPGTGPHVEYRSPEEAPVTGPPGTKLKSIMARPLNQNVIPMVKWGDFEYWFYEIDDDIATYEAIIVAEFDLDGIMKGFSVMGTKEESHRDSPYVYAYSRAIYDVS